MTADPRRHIPRTDDVLADPQVGAVATGVHPLIVRAAVRRAQEQARQGLIEAEAVVACAVNDLARVESRAVINATGVIVHTNLGRSVLCDAAQAALVRGSGYAAVEYDLSTGRRSRRGRLVTQDLLDRVPNAEDALVVNNGAAALLLSVLALPGDVLLARGEMVEIGDGFRLHELLAGAGRPVTEVGATNRVHLRDYADAAGEGTGCIVKVHPSNFEVVGFTSSVPVETVASLGHPVIADIGSGLLQPHPGLPREPDAHSALAQGAALVTFSTDKLLGGPQGGVIMGRADLVQRARRHPLARSMRADKLAFAALSATLRAEQKPPTLEMLQRSEEGLLERLCQLQKAVGGEVVSVSAVVGGGAAPGVSVPGPALSLAGSLARRLRVGQPAVITRTHARRCLIDLRCVPPGQDGVIAEAVRAALGPSQ